MQPVNSVITGVIERTSGPGANPTGTALSPTGSESLPAGGEHLAARLLRATSRENDRAVLASLTQRHGCTLKASSDYTPGKRRYSVIRSYELTKAPEADVAGAITTVRAAMTAASTDQILGWLAEMSVKCAIREQSEFSGELTLKVYAKELAAYPADIVRDVLTEWAQDSKWWPTWHELYERLEEDKRPRALMLWTLQNRGHDDERLAAFLADGTWNDDWGFKPSHHLSHLNNRWRDIEWKRPRVPAPGPEEPAKS